MDYVTLFLFLDESFSFFSPFNEYLVAKIGFDEAKNQPCTICPWQATSMCFLRILRAQWSGLRSQRRHSAKSAPEGSLALNEGEKVRLYEYKSPNLGPMQGAPVNIIGIQKRITTSKQRKVAALPRSSHKENDLSVLTDLCSTKRGERWTLIRTPLTVWTPAQLRSARNKERILILDRERYTCTKKM